MNINIICVGKLKEKFFRDAVSEYAKRLQKYCKLKVIELSDEKIPENASQKEELQVKQKEGEKILSNIKTNMYVVALDLRGKMISSEELSGFISNLEVRGTSNFAFVIGGSLGLSKPVLDRADYKLCFSKMTFPHQLFRVMLLEQIYRAFKIMNNETYHK